MNAFKNKPLRKRRQVNKFIDKILNQIPGHFLAFTWFLAISAGVVAFLVSWRFTASLGMILFVIGAFLADQATHLARHHDEQPPTWLEKEQKEHKLLFQVLGVILANLGILVAFSD